MACKFIIYGQPGIGKTTYIGSSKTGITTIPEALPVLYLDFDDKTKVIKSNINEIPLSEIGTWESLDKTKLNKMYFSITQYNMEAVYAQMSRLMGEAGCIFDEDFPFKTIILDSATHLSELLSRYILKKNDAKRSNAETLSKNDYGMVANLQGRFLANLIHSGKHIILSCHTKVEYFKDSDIIKSEAPLFVGQMTRQVIPGKADFGGYLYLDNQGNRKLDWKGEGLAYYRWTNPSNEVGSDDPDLPTEANFSLLRYLFQENPVK